MKLLNDVREYIKDPQLLEKFNQHCSNIKNMNGDEAIANTAYDVACHFFTQQIKNDLKTLGLSDLENRIEFIKYDDISSVTELNPYDMQTLMVMTLDGDEIMIEKQTNDDFGLMATLNTICSTVYPYDFMFSFPAETINQEGKKLLDTVPNGHNILATVFHEQLKHTNNLIAQKETLIRKNKTNEYIDYCRFIPQFSNGEMNNVILMYTSPNEDKKVIRQFSNDRDMCWFIKHGLIGQDLEENTKGIVFSKTDEVDLSQLSNTVYAYVPSWEEKENGLCHSNNLIANITAYSDNTNYITAVEQNNQNLAKNTKVLSKTFGIS